MSDRPKHTCNVPGLCPRCTNELRTALDGILDTWTAAHDELLPGGTWTGGNSRAFGSKIPASLTALSWINGTPILDILGSWERLIRENRDLTRAGLLPPRHLSDEIARLVDFHRAHTKWISEQPWATDMLLEVQELHHEGRQAARLLDNRLRVSCPATTTDDDICGCRLVMPDNPDEHITCRWCGTVWTQPWLERVAFDQAEWLDASLIERAYKIHEATLRRWAKHEHVRREHTGYGIVYNAADLRAHIAKTGRETQRHASSNEPANV